MAAEGALIGADLSSDVTVVVVTSPTASNPSTEMIDRCMAGVMLSFPALKHCAIVIACDGVQVVDSSGKDAVRSKRIFGKCNQDSYDRYQQYCDALEAREWLRVDRQTEWKGFALTLKSALKLVMTPLAMVLPHDYELAPQPLSHLNIAVILQTMLKTLDLNYLGLPNPRSATIKSRHAQALRDLPCRSIPGGNGYDVFLEPIGMWKENPHIAKTDAYFSIVFSRCYKRGHFIEDTLGQEMLAEIKEKGLGGFHHTYMLSLNEPCSFHMDGPRYLPISERQSKGFKIQDFEIRATELANEYMHQRARKA